ncbi:MAG: FHIPEP family type III secretion protein, partial [Planctomycetes bacterium]|nr:FHIPEP family type III secretion protein [Planctomycetota bacterium]
MTELTNSKKGLRNEAILGFGVISMIFVLIIPLPPMMLDVLIAVNIAFATLVLLITLGAREALELSTYPTLLLLTTLFRLSLNVASTRLILLKGQAGEVIQAFGDFVVGGDLVVGVVIFIILLIIQFVVITKGSGRISEVAARFTLDAMPGKQMAIDADLNAGMITEEDARDRREKIAFEAEFYGAMDGAGKFVRGDAVAGLIINIINVVGGVIIGVSQNLEVSAALQKYSILTIGDGLVSQTPALIIAVSSGILVTKSSSKEQFATDFSLQLLRNSRALGIGAAAIGMMAFIPGFPSLPFLGIAVAIFFARKHTIRVTAEAEAAEKKSLLAPEPEEDGPELTPEALGRLLLVDRMGIEIGYRLIQMVDADKKGGLLDHIGMIRRQFAREQGMVVPAIRLRDNLSLEPNEYRVLIAGQTVARGRLYPGHLMAMNPGMVSDEIQGIQGEDPTFGLPAVWIKESQRSEAEMFGYTVVDPVSVLVTHLTETIRVHAADLLTREDVQTLLDRLKESAPTVVKELVPDVLNMGEVQLVLQDLLRERIPIKNLPAILETLADH